MSHAQPTPDKTIRDDFTTDKIIGSSQNDHLIHHRDLSIQWHAGVGLVGLDGDDILEGSVPNGGQIHMFAAEGDDWLILDVTKIPDAIGHQSHHAYGGHGQDTFQFKNIKQNHSPIVGRLDDFDPTSDHILIEDVEIDLTNLPQSIELPGGGIVEVRVIEVEHPEFMSENLGSQYFLAIGQDIFYALEGARDLGNGTSGLIGEERHFLKQDALQMLRSAETVSYENPHNFVPHGFYQHRENDLNLNWNPAGEEVFADSGDKSAAHIFGSKSNPDNPSSSGTQVMHGSPGNDVIDGNSGNDTIFGGLGNDMIAGGIDNDTLYGGHGNDMIWGGDGDDIIEAGQGNDSLYGGRGDDLITSGLGNNTISAGRGHDAVHAFSGINTIHGGPDSDLLLGGFQADTIDGGDGNDVLRGDADSFLGGPDTLIGGPGDDFLMGGLGADTFVFKPNDGNDIIAAFNVEDIVFGPSGYSSVATGTDFQPGIDKIHLSEFSNVDPANLLSFVREGVDGAVFSAERTTITFFDLNAAQLSVDDFIFG
ncbi:calcium-binding protein [Yoonia sp.]|uniref:calcium-binding protein n=1 Tax=Yoonia sp. TaxID=2212373 RepID=UPI003975B9FA